MYPVFLQILGIFAIIFCGWAMGRRQWFNPLFSADLSRLLIWFFYPALIYSSIVRTFTFSGVCARFWLPLGAAGILLLGWSVGWVARRMLRGYRAPTRRSFHFACMMNNYSFLPIMIVAPWGEEWVAMVALSALGSDVLMWSLGFKTLTGRRFGVRELHRLISPPVVALFAAVLTLAALAVLGQPRLPLFWETGLEVMYGAGKSTIPVSALICGLRMATTPLASLWSRLQGITCFLRLILIPALALGIIWFLPLDPELKRLLSILAMMPGAMAGVSLAEIYGGDPGYMSAMILSTHLLCLATVPLWMWLFSFGG